MPPKVGAIIVTYHPQASQLGQLLQRLSDEVAVTLVVDNSVQPDARACVEALCRQHRALWLPQAGNPGLAAGLNAGLAALPAQACTHALLLDQDSLPQPGMVGTLLDTWQRHSADAAPPVGAVGPAFLDPRGAAPPPFVRLGFPVPHVLARPTDGRSAVECDFLITSGCLIPLHVLETVGGMDDGLFIDNVDLEWCFRARSHGFRLLGEFSAQMQHSLGDTRLRLAWLPRKAVIVHSPLRLYYIMRNRVLLQWLGHVPGLWKLQDLLRIPYKLLIFACIVPPRRANLRMMLRGLWHGLIRRKGPCPSSPRHPG